MKLELFSYNLPKRSIAQKPIEPRDHSKLLIYNRPTRKIINDHFYRLDTYLRPGDVLVFNDTKVFPARLIGHKQTGGRIEVFLLKATRGNHWEALIGGKVRRVGQVISFGSGLRCKVEKQFPNGIWQVGFNKKPSLVMAIAGKIGETPTPPYVKKITKLSDYQTVYAKKVGSVAAPTAGFHFTKQLLAKLKKQGVQFEYVTLHIGYGTFQPVKANDIKKHKMHAEYAELGKRTVQRLMSAKKKGRRIIAVGTTSVRALETVYRLPATDYQPTMSSLQHSLNLALQNLWRNKLVTGATILIMTLILLIFNDIF